MKKNTDNYYDFVENMYTKKYALVCFRYTGNIYIQILSIDLNFKMYNSYINKLIPPYKLNRTKINKNTIIYHSPRFKCLIYPIFSTVDVYKC